MERKDKIGTIMGHVKYVGRDKDGNINYQREHDFPLEHNTVCDLYYDGLAFLVAGGSGPTLTHGHCGTGSGQGATDTNLATYFAEARTAVDSSVAGTGANLHKVITIVTFGAGICTGTITEVGLFTNSAQATADMKVYDDTINYAKGAGDSLEVTWTITHSN